MRKVYLIIFICFILKSGNSQYVHIYTWYGCHQRHLSLLSVNYLIGYTTRSILIGLKSLLLLFCNVSSKFNQNYHAFSMVCDV